MRVALIEPAGISKGLNVGLAMLSACLRRAGHEVSVFDLNNDNSSYASRIRAAASYDRVGFSLKSFVIRSALEAAAAFKRSDLVCGGLHVTIDGESFLRDNARFQIGFIGEAEENIAELFSALEKKLPLEGIPGIMFRDAQGNLAVNPAPSPVDIDALPFPDYAAFDSVHGHISDYPVITSRGCPYSCIYCCVGKVFGEKIRFRGIASVVNEIEEARARYGSSRFHILDDNFTFDAGRAKDFCRLLLKRKIRMEWRCSNGVRADRMDEELACLMKRSGCRQVSMGIESLDGRVFANIKRGEALKDIYEALRLFKKYHISVSGYFLIGLPGDDFRTCMHSLKLAQRLPLRTSLWHILAAYPGTPVWETVKREARIIGDWKDGIRFGPLPKVTFETDRFTGKEKIAVYTIANVRSRNYGIFFDRKRSLPRNLLTVCALILRYDLPHVFNHLCFLLSNITTARKYVEVLRK